jgi:hypothetical protein
MLGLPLLGRTPGAAGSVVVAALGVEVFGGDAWEIPRSADFWFVRAGVGAVGVIGVGIGLMVVAVGGRVA